MLAVRERLFHVAHQRRLPAQILDIFVYAAHLRGNVDSLRTVRAALVAARALARLTQLRDGAVVAHEKRAAGFEVVFVDIAFGRGTLVNTLVVVKQNRGNVERVRARHTIFAVVARYRVELHHLVGGALEEVEFLACEHFQRRVGFQVVLQVLHFHHSAQYCQDVRETPRKTERPRRNRTVGLALLELGDDCVGNRRKPAAQQRLHYHDGNLAFFELAVQILRVCVERHDLLGVRPVEIVQLDLTEFHLVRVLFQKRFQRRQSRMRRKAQMADAPVLFLLQQIWENVPALVFVDDDGIFIDVVQ